VPLDSLQDKHKIWNPSGRPLSRSQRYMPHVSASRPNSFSRCAEPPPRPPSRSRRTASRRGRSPAPLGQRAGGLRCSRLHSGVCSHTPIARPRVAAQRVAGGNPGQDDPGTVRTLDPHLGRAPGLGRRFPDDRGPAAASPACSVRTSRTWIQIITGPRRAVRVPGDLTEPRPGAEDHFGIGRRAELPVGRQARTSR
jgi:hypothetical protein